MDNYISNNHSFSLFVSETGKVDPTPHTSSFNMGYLVSPYPYPNGAGGPIPVSMVSRSPVMLLFGFIPVKFGMPRTCHHSHSSPPFVPERRRGASVYRVFCVRAPPPPPSGLVELFPLDRDHAIDLWRPQIGFAIYIYRRPVPLFHELTINREDRVVF